MLFREFVEVCKRIRAAKGINEKIGLIASYLKRLDREEWIPYILFLTGNPVPDTLEGGLGVGHRTLVKAMKNPVRPLIGGGPPSLLEVYGTLLEIAGMRGRDSQARREGLLRSLMGRLSKEEREWLASIIMGEPRIGVMTGHVLRALAHALHISEDKVRRLYMLRGSIHEVAELLARGVDPASVGPRLYKPLRPMLGTPATTVTEAFNILGVSRAAAEEKYDGFRIQIHIGDRGVRIFSRNLLDVTQSFPELVEYSSRIEAREAILDGEAVALGRDGRPLPFQYLMRRFKRVEDVEDYMDSIPVTMRLFDVIYLDGELLIDRPYIYRRERLERIVPEEYLARVVLDASLSEAEAMYREAIEAGHEGIMLKRMDSPYVLGSRGRYWAKVKEKETLDLVIVGAEWGHGRRRGWLSDYYLAAYNPRTGGYEIVGKTFKGLTDEEFQYMTRRLKELVVRDEGYRVFVKPEIVVEVDFNEVQESPKYRSGYALRLARIRRIREDKSPEEAATIDDIRRIYEEQFRRKARL